MSNPKRWVIGDIHGCPLTLAALIDQVGPGQEDRLYLLGDYVNKGPDSTGVIDRIINWQKEGLGIYPLLGNHELNLLEANQDPDELMIMVAAQNSTDLVNTDGQLHPKYLHFMEGLAHFVELPDYLLVHAGFDFSLSDPFQDLETMLNIRDFPYDHLQAKGRTIVHGHNPKTLSEIEACLAADGYIIPLDNGCVYKGQRDGMGNLLALNLDNRELYLQPNIDT